MKIKDPIYVKNKTKEGLDYVLHPREDTYSIYIMAIVKSGSIYDTTPGTSHLLEHMVLKSTKKTPYYKRQKSLEFKGASDNGYTNYDHNWYYTYLPFNQIDYGFKYIKETLVDAKLDEKELITEKKVIADEIDKYNSDPYDISYRKYKKNLLNNNSSYYTDILGTKKNLNSIQEKDLRQHYNLYNPKNIYIGVSGKFNEKKVHTKISELSKYINTNKKEPKLKNTRVRKHKAKKVYFDESKLTKNSILSYVKIGKGFKNYNVKRVYPKRILNQILISGDTSYFFQELRVKSGLLYSYWNINDIRELLSFRGFGLECNPKNIKEVIKTIKGAIHTLQKEKVKESEIKHWKEHLRNKIYIGNDNHIRVLQNALWDKVKVNKFYTPKEHIQLVNNVGKPKVDKEIKEYDLDNYSMFFFGNVKELKDQGV